MFEFGIPGIGFSFGLFGLAAFIFWIWSLIDCIRSDLKTDEKLLWVLIIVILNFVGSVIYLVVYKNQGKHLTRKHAQKGKHLKRSKQNRVIAGVCGGLGEYFDIDPTIIRLLFVLAFFFGSGFLAYIIMWIVMPEE
ncbi:MAG: PspC domain-containing protein [Candidatus Woesearchaeota archaeon]